VPLPDAWREEMEIGEDFAHHAAEEEDDYSEYERSRGRVAKTASSVCFVTAV
jgi:hypothetical protein